MMVVGVGQLDYGLGNCGKVCGDGWGQGTIATYTKFYVNPPGSQPLPRQKEQATVRPSHRQPLGPVTVGRRCAAGGCADAQGPLTRTRRPVWSWRGSSVRSVDIDVGLDLAGHR